MEKIVDLLREIAEERIALAEGKNAGYADAKAPMFNLDLVEIVSHGKVSRETGIFVRITDKIARLGNTLFGVPDEVGESVEDTLKDLANYSDLLLIAWREKHPNYSRMTDQQLIDEASTQIAKKAAEVYRDTPVVKDPQSILSRFFSKT